MEDIYELNDVELKNINSEKKQSKPEGVILVAIYQFISAIPGIIVGAAILMIALPAVLMNVDDQIGLLASIFGLSLAVLFTLGLSLVSILAGLGLIGLKNWARWLACGLALLIVWAVPVGTLIGGAILVYLLQPNIKKCFIK